MVKQALVILQDAQYKVEAAITFHQSNGLKGQQSQTMLDDLKGPLIQKVEYAQCKCQAKFLMQ